MNLNKEIICPICGEVMEMYLYDYNTNPEEKVNYSCSNCGHKETKIIK